MTEAAAVDINMHQQQHTNVQEPQQEHGQSQQPQQQQEQQQHDLLPPIGAHVQLSLDAISSGSWNAVVYDFKPPDQHIILFDDCVYRLLQLKPGTWSLQHAAAAPAADAAVGAATGTAPASDSGTNAAAGTSAAGAPPRNPELDQALLLLNKTVRVQLGGVDGTATEAVVVAYNADKKQQHVHVLHYNDKGHHCDLQQHAWELVEDEKLSAAAAAGRGGGAAGGVVSASSQQHKRKQTQQSSRSTRARLAQQPQQQPQDAATMPDAAAAAAAKHAAAAAGSAGSGKTVNSASAEVEATAASLAVQVAAPPVTAGDRQTAGAPVSNQPQRIQPMQVEPAVNPTAAAAGGTAGDGVGGSSACQEGPAPAPAAAATEGSSRPQRNRQASKRLVLPGEEPDGKTPVVGKQQQQQQRGVSVMQSGSMSQQQQQQQEWPSDAELLQAVAAADVPCLPPGMGVICCHRAGSGKSESKMLTVQVALDSFRLGNPVSCHVPKQQQQQQQQGPAPRQQEQQFSAGSTAGAHLFRQVSSNEQSSWDQVSRACHDCGQPHIPRTCQQPGCDMNMSVCNRCLLQHYHTLYSLSELLHTCPPCRKACACSSCLANADPAQLVPLLQYNVQQQARQAQYVLQELLPLLADMLQQQQAEACAWGYASLQDVTPSPLDLLVRPLCDRCATQIAGVAATCAQCGWDYCCECAAALRQHAQSAAEAPATAEAEAAAGAAVRPVQVTCCNPECSKQDGSSGQSEQCAHLQGAEQHQGGEQQQQQQQQPQQGVAAPPGMGQHIGAVFAYGSGTGSQDGSGQSESSEDGEGEGEGEGVSVVRQELFGLPGNAVLQLQLVLPPDLLEEVGQLQTLAQNHKPTSQPLQLQDCPLLNTADLQMLQSRPLTAPGTGHPVTLQQLQTPTWWQYLPAELRETWRRSAALPGWPGAHHQQQQRQSVAAASTPQQQAAGASVPQQQQHGPSSSCSGGCLFTPHVSELHGAGPVGLLARLVFWARWRLGEPIIVRGVKGEIPWDPRTLERAMGCGRGNAEMSVLDCADFSTVNVTHKEFFIGYLQGQFVEQVQDGAVQQEAVMYKLKDWPPSADIRHKLCRHYSDFLAALPLRCYTEPRLGVSGGMNLATCLQARDNPTDLGPKCYIAYGRVAETEGEGDSVTKVHNDMTDAVNLLLDTAPGGDPDAQQLAQQQQQQQQQHGRCGDQAAQLPGYQGAGAVWDIWSRGALQSLNAYLASDAGRFTHMGHSVLDLGDPLVSYSPVLSQAFMLAQTHRQAFKTFIQQQQQQVVVHQEQPQQQQEHGQHVEGEKQQQQQQQQEYRTSGGQRQQQEQQGIQLWHFEQYDGEAVFIPGGCAHQVRNLKSCCKVAADFVSPESMCQALAHKARLRDADLNISQPLEDGPHERQCQEKLQSQLMLLRGALRAARALKQQQQHSQQQ